MHVSVHVREGECAEVLRGILFLESLVFVADSSVSNIAVVVVSSSGLDFLHSAEMFVSSTTLCFLFLGISLFFRFDHVVRLGKLAIIESLRYTVVFWLLLRANKFVYINEIVFAGDQLNHYCTLINYRSRGFGVLGFWGLGFRV
jgi:hypothetical protein